MIQEYLFFDSKEEGKIRDIYDEYSEEVSIFDEQFGDGEAYIIQFETATDNINDAKLLSKLDKELTSSLHPITLTNEASAYFNKKLYPLFNEFERKLRKVFYLASTFYDVEKAEQIVKDIEDYDFGKIYKILFTDESFKNEVRVKFGKDKHYSKQDMLKTIDKMSENTIWGELFKDGHLEIVPREFLHIREHRNHTMHAHNIGYEEYIKAKNLLGRVNKEIDTEIGRFLNTNLESIPKIDMSEIADSIRKYAEALRNSNGSNEMIKRIRDYVIAVGLDKSAYEQYEEDDYGQVENGN